MGRALETRRACGHFPVVILEVRRRGLCGWKRTRRRPRWRNPEVISGDEKVTTLMFSYYFNNFFFFWSSPTVFSRSVIASSRTVCGFRFDCKRSLFYMDLFPRLGKSTRPKTIIKMAAVTVQLSTRTSTGHGRITIAPCASSATGRIDIYRTRSSAADGVYAFPRRTCTRYDGRAQTCVSRTVRDRSSVAHGIDNRPDEQWRIISVSFWTRCRTRRVPVQGGVRSHWTIFFFAFFHPTTLVHFHPLLYPR